MLHNFLLLDMSIFDELVIKNDPVKKETPFFVFMEVVYLLHNQVLVVEDSIFHRRVLSKLYRNSKFNVLVNFNFFHQHHTGFRVSQSLVKDAQGFGEFSQRYLNSEKVVH